MFRLSSSFIFTLVSWGLNYCNDTRPLESFQDLRRSIQKVVSLCEIINTLNLQGRIKSFSNTPDHYLYTAAYAV